MPFTLKLVAVLLKVRLAPELLRLRVFPVPVVIKIPGRRKIWVMSVVGAVSVIEELLLKEMEPKPLLPLPVTITVVLVNTPYSLL